MAKIYNYTAKAKFIETNRLRTLQCRAISPELAKAQVINKGYAEPITIEKSDDTAPTDAQLNYCKNLKVSVPDGATLQEVSDLIDCAVSKDSPANPQLIEYAQTDLGLDVSDYIGKRKLYNYIWASIDDHTRYAFFALQVYRWLSDDREVNLNTHKYKQLFFDFADLVANDTQFINSIKRSFSQGENVRFFGTIYANQTSYEGGSVQTIAYKKAVEYLSKNIGLKNRTVYIVPETRRDKKQRYNPVIKTSPSVDYFSHKPALSTGNTRFKFVIFVIILLLTLLILFSSSK